MNVVRPTPSGMWTVFKNPFRGQFALANMSQFTITLANFHDGLFVGIDLHGAYSFSNYAHWSYVQEKLDLKYESDARNVADLINDQLGIERERQGTYLPKLCCE